MLRGLFIYFLFFSNFADKVITDSISIVNICHFALFSERQIVICDCEGCETVIIFLESLLIED